jgi:hypothetical protein
LKRLGADGKLFWSRWRCAPWMLCQTKIYADKRISDS